MGRPPCCNKSNVKRGLWTAEEDAKILAYVSNHGTGNWTLVPKKAGLNRCGKSCRLRWTNYLRPDLKHDSFTPQEEEIIINLHKLMGSRWSLIAKHLPGRTDNDVKNYWNTKLKKKLSNMGIDPVTHKPISQVLSDYRNISNIPNNGTPVVRKNLDSTLVSKHEPSPNPTRLQNKDMVMKPLMIEQVQDNSSNTKTGSWDFSTQFPVFSEVSPCCSSSSPAGFKQLSSPQSTSYEQSQAQATPSSCFSWREFLLNDPILPLPGNLQQQQEHKGTLSTARFSTLTQKETSQFKSNDENEHYLGTVTEHEGLRSFDSASTKPNQADHVSSSSASSFVEAILVRDSEIRSEFPELFYGSLDF